MCFSKNDPGSFYVQNQVKLAYFELIASHFGHSKVTKCLENGLLGVQKSVKNGSKMCFFKDTFRLFGVHKQLECVHFEAILSNFGPSQGRKGLENGPIWDHKWLKKGSNTWLSKRDLGPVVVLKWMNLALFEPVLSRSNPLSSAYLIGH